MVKAIIRTRPRNLQESVLEETKGGKK